MLTSLFGVAPLREKAAIILILMAAFSYINPG